MSFSRSFTYTVSGSVSYPASEHGGSRDFSKDLTVVVTVDTEAIDRAAERCTAAVGAMTGGIVAETSLLEKEKGESANRISSSLVGGFFKYILYGIRETMMRLGTRMPMLLQELKALARRCSAAREQLGKDYEKITTRYSKVFTDLDESLRKSLEKLDQPTFFVAQSACDFVGKTMLSQTTATTLLGGPEEIASSTAIEMARLKDATREAVSQCARNIRYNLHLVNQIEHMLVVPAGVGEHSIMLPVVELGSDDIDNLDNDRVDFFFADGLPAATSETLNMLLPEAASQANSGGADGIPPPEVLRQIDQFFKKRLSNCAASEESIARRDRVVSNVMRMWEHSLGQSGGKNEAE